MSTIIKVRCTDQVLTFENTPVITSGGLGSDVVQFEFCDKWDDHALVAVFWREEAYAYQVSLDTANSCRIPAEVLAEPGVFYFGVYGILDENTRRTSEVLNYPVGKGPILDAIVPTEPTPDVYTQLLAQYAAIGPAVTKALERVEATEQSIAEFTQQCDEVLSDAVERVGEVEQQVAGKAQQFAEDVTELRGLINAVSQQSTEGDAALQKQVTAAANQAATHASRHAAGGADPITPAAIGAEPANTDLVRYTDGMLQTGSGTEVKVASDEYQMRTVWLVPYSYPTVTAFATTTSSTVQTLDVDLPEAIDLSTYCYEFHLTVYGLQRYGDLSGANINLQVSMVSDAGSVSYATLLWPVARTVGYTETKKLSFPMTYTGHIRTMPGTTGYVAWEQGYKNGEIVTQYEGESVRNTLGQNYVAAGKYPKLRLQFQCGANGANPVQTFGIRFDYRAYMKKE